MQVVRTLGASLVEEMPEALEAMPFEEALPYEEEAVEAVPWEAARSLGSYLARSLLGIEPILLLLYQDVQQAMLRLSVWLPSNICTKHQEFLPTFHSDQNSPHCLFVWHLPQPLCCWLRLSSFSHLQQLSLLLVPWLLGTP